MTDPTTDPTGLDRELPYEGTGQDLRLMIARHAYRDEQAFGAIQDATRLREMTGDDLARMATAHHACLYGWRGWPALGASPWSTSTTPRTSATTTAGC